MEKSYKRACWGKIHQSWSIQGTINTSASDCTEITQALSTFASVITSSAVSSSFVLSLKIIYGILTVDTGFTSSFSTGVRASLLVDGFLDALCPWKSLQDIHHLEEVLLSWSRSLLATMDFKLTQFQHKGPTKKIVLCISGRQICHPC